MIGWEALGFILEKALFTCLGTLFIGMLASFACWLVRGGFDVVSQRTVVWCIALGFVLGKCEGTSIAVSLSKPIPMEDANAIGKGLGYLLALLLLWYFMYYRNRGLGYGERA